FFFFQAEDGIRDKLVTGVQTCALPISSTIGIPIVEAMASGVPVVASSHPSLDEAAGPAALRADPDDAQAWADALVEARERRDELVPLGLEHARGFTWRRVGETMLAAWEAAR